MQCAAEGECLTEKRAECAQCLASSSLLALPQTWAQVNRAGLLYEESYADTVSVSLQAHSQNDISDIYRYPLVTKGIFVNPALQEPFGLTVIEVSVHAPPKCMLAGDGTRSGTLGVESPRHYTAESAAPEVCRLLRVLHLCFEANPGFRSQKTSM